MSMSRVKKTVIICVTICALLILACISMLIAFKVLSDKKERIKTNNYICRSDLLGEIRIDYNDFNGQFAGKIIIDGQEVTTHVICNGDERYQNFNYGNKEYFITAFFDDYDLICFLYYELDNARPEFIERLDFVKKN